MPARNLRKIYEYLCVKLLIGVYYASASQAHFSIDRGLEVISTCFGPVLAQSSPSIFRRFTSAHRGEADIRQRGSPSKSSQLNFYRKIRRWQVFRIGQKFWECLRAAQTKAVGAFLRLPFNALCYGVAAVRRPLPFVIRVVSWGEARSPGTWVPRSCCATPSI